jgi:hypothetical protein
VSVLDQFRDAEQRVAQRLKELEPAVAEYRELEKVARRLGLDAAAPNGAAEPAADAPAPRKASRPRARRSTTAKASTGRAAARPAAASRPRRATASPGQRRDQLVALVRERPGITVAEAGKELGVDPTGLYRVVRRLEQRGELRKRGRNLEPGTAAS